MRRLFSDIHDINLDVPAAYSLLDQLVAKLHAKRVLGEALLKDIPSRFVSEFCRFGSEFGNPGLSIAGFVNTR
jgi:hypothetical protein